MAFVVHVLVEDIDYLLRADFLTIQCGSEIKEIASLLSLVQSTELRAQQFVKIVALD